MSDWARKHLGDLTEAVKEQIAAPTPASRPHRQQLEEILGLAKLYSPHPGSSANHQKIVATLCSYCADLGLYPCKGRFDWQSPCAFVADRKK